MGKNAHFGGRKLVDVLGGQPPLHFLAILPIDKASDLCIHCGVEWQDARYSMLPA